MGHVLEHSIRLFFMTALLFSMMGMAGQATPLLSVDFEGSVPGARIDGKPEYVPGISGKGIRLSESLVEFPAIPKLTEESGTVTFWVRPVNWEWKKEQFVFLLTNACGMVNLYKSHVPLGLVFNFGNKGKAMVDYVYANALWDSFPDKTWMAMGISWNRKGHLIAIYINGEKVASANLKDNMVPEKLGSWILNAPAYSPRDRKNATEFDSLRVYDRALTEEEIASLFRKERPSAISFDYAKLRPTRFHIPQLAAAPHLDGNVDIREWNGAARLGGMMTSRSLDTAYPSEVYAGYHGEKLYFCYVFALPGATKITAEQTKRDTPVYADDAAELILHPDNAADSEFYQGIFNSRCTIFDQHNANHPEWDGAWEVKTGMYEGYLNIEIAIPFSELGRPFQDGMEWGFNCARDRINNREIIFSSASPFASSNFFSELGTMRFTEAGLSGRLKLDYAALFQRRLALQFRVNNRSAAAKNIQFAVELVSPEGMTVEKKSFTAAVASNANVSFDYANPLQGLRGALLRLTATAEGEAKPFYVQDLPLAFKDEFRIADETDLVKNTVMLEIDCTSHRKTGKAAKVIGKLGGQTIEFTGIPLAKGSFDLSRMTPGDYQIHLQFLDGAGETLLEYDYPYTHIGQPEWLTKHAGQTNEVVWPYTPIEYKDNLLSVWGRTHRFGGALLPAIMSQNQPIFSKTPELHLTVNGNRAIVKDFKFTVREQRADRLVLDMSAHEKGVTFKGTMTAEYDGFLWYDLDMTGEKSATVSNLELVLPMDKQTASFFNAHYFSREKQAGALQCPMALKRFPSLWVGNLDVGITFMVESFQSWRNADERRTFTFDTDGKSVFCRIHFIDRPVKLDRAFHYGFAVEANPVKPNPSWARSWRIQIMSPANIMHPWAFDRFKTKKYSGEGGFFTPVFKSLDIFRGLVRDFKAKGIAFSLYLNPFLVSNEATEFKIFQKEWNNPLNCYPECPNSTFTDYIMDCVSTLVDNGLKAVYVDSLGAVGCCNPRHGCGYTDEETGEAMVTWPIRGMRNYMKRLYTLLHGSGRNPRENFIWAHTSARNNAALNAFLDATSGGEEMEDRLAAEPHYLNLYPLDEYQVFYLHSVAGWPMAFANFERIGPEANRYNHDLNDEFLMLLLMHDTSIWNEWLDTSYVNKLYAQLDEWGLKDESLVFHNYRRQPFVKTNAKEICISLYQLKDRTLAVIGNWQRTPRSIAITVDGEALGLGNSLTYTDLLTKQPVSIDNIHLKGANFMLLDIRKK